MCLVRAKHLDVAVGSHAGFIDGPYISEMRALQAQFDDPVASVCHAVLGGIVPQSCRVRLCLEVAE